MARPTQSRVRGRAQVSASTSSAQLDVVAPLAAPMDTSKADSWANLRGALGVLGTAAGKTAAARDEHNEAQGMADQRMNKVDKERLERQNRYAEGVTKAKTITETQAALAEIDERAVTELPADATADEAIAWYDKQAMEILGPLANDPKARLTIAPMYQDFLEKVAGRTVAAHREQNRATVTEAFEVQINRALEGAADVDFGAMANDGAAVFTGGRSEAWATIVEMTAAKAEEVLASGAPDAAVRATELLNSLPDKVTTEDGQTIDSPIRSKLNKARLNTAYAKIEKWKDEVAKPGFEWEKAEVENSFNERINNGEVLDFAEGERYVKSGHFTEDEWNGIVQRSIAEDERRRKAKEEEGGGDAAMSKYGAESPRDLIGVSDGFKNLEAASKYNDKKVEDVIVGWAKANGIEPPPVTGPQLLNPDFAQIRRNVLAYSNKTRLPYRPLENALKGLTSSTGKTLMDRLDLYRDVRASGTEGMYLDDDTSALYDAALTMAMDDMKPEEIAQALRRTNDPATREAVASKREDIAKRAMKGDFEVVNSMWDANVVDATSGAYAARRTRQLAEMYVTRAPWAAPEDAIEWAKTKFAEKHFGVELNGRTVILPSSDSYDSAAAAAALEWYASGTEGYAKANKIEGEIQTRVYTGAGMQPTVVYVDEDERPVPGMAERSIEWIVQRFAARSPDTYKEAVRRARVSQNARTEQNDLRAKHLRAVQKLPRPSNGRSY